MDETASERTLPTLVVGGPWNWDQAAGKAQRTDLAAVMAEAIATRRWFGAKTRAIESLEIIDAIGFSATVRLLLVRIHFSRGPAEVYQVPLGFADAQSAARLLEENGAVWIRVESAGGRRLGVLYDALGDADFCRQLLELFESPRTLNGIGGELISTRTSCFHSLRGNLREILIPKPVETEQSNSSVIYGSRLILKVFRRVEMGLNPDFEITDYLTRQHFANTPPLAGLLEYRPANEEPWTLAMLQAFVPNQQDAWNFARDWLAKALDARAADSAGKAPPVPREGICSAAQRAIPPEASAAFGGFLASVELLGRRTAEMHRALSADAADPAFAPEPFTDSDRRRFFERCSEQARETFALLGDHLPRLPRELASQAARALALEPAALDRYRRLAAETASVAKIRCHGDYHLGQVLVAKSDFVMIDFEGEPARPLSQRREKQLALRDVAGMIRSLHYASCSAAAAARSDQTRDDRRLREWAHAWFAWTSVAFLSAYVRTAGEAVFLPRAIDEFERLLDGCLLEKAIYELRYELDNRPDWVYLPLEALAEILDDDRH
ncbi:MAG: putative maltokinase [Pirellulales bacterium]